jgi:6-phosphogluconolactonase
MRGFGGRASEVWVGIAMAVALQCPSGRAEGPEAVAKGDGATFAYFAGSNFSGGKTNAIGVYRLSSEDGGLTPLVEQPLEGPGPMAVNAESRRLYAVNYPDKIHAYEIDAGSGSLKSLADVQLPGRPEYLALDRRGRFLLAAMYHQQQVLVCPLDGQGRPQVDQVQVLASGLRPHSILSDRHDKFVYVPCAGEIWQYAWTEDGTGLGAQPVARHKAPKDSRPRHLWFHPNKDWLYVVNESGRSLTFYRVAPDTGGLTAVQTLSTVPEDVVKGSGADVHVTPDGRFVYASTREHDSIAGFTIDQNSGEITPLGQTATARGPRDFAIDPSGRFLVAGGTGRAIVVHAIDQETGQTTTKHRYDVRSGSVWVEVVSFRNKESKP